MEMLSQFLNSLNMTTLQSIRQQILTQTNIKSRENMIWNPSRVNRF